MPHLWQNVLKYMDSAPAKSDKIFHGSTTLIRGTDRTTPASDAKGAALEAAGTLNRNPQAVLDPLFRGAGFFDPRDQLQLRYEMVRRNRVESVPVVMTAQLFGVSLPTAYQAQAAFATAGLAGLLPKRRGPKQGHKLTPEILEHIEQCRRERPDWGTGELLAELRRTFGLTIHRRSLERVLQGKKKLASR
jgi:transposase